MPIFFKKVKQRVFCFSVFSVLGDEKGCKNILSLTLLKTNCIYFIQGLRVYHTGNTLHLGYTKPPGQCCIRQK